MKTTITILTLALLALAADDIHTHKLNHDNDGAATECAIRTGFLYNCTDGTQSVSCH